MSSDEGGVGTRSSSVRRVRPRRGGALRTSTTVAGGLRGARLAALRLAAAFFTFGARRFVLAARRVLVLEARRVLLGRLAERTARLVFFPFFAVPFRAPLFRLAIRESFRNLDSFA